MTHAEAAAHLAVCRAIVADTDQSILTTSRLVAALFAVAEFYAAECARLEAVSRLDVEHLNALGRTLGELRDMMPGVAPPASLYGITSVDVDEDPPPPPTPWLRVMPS